MIDRERVNTPIEAWERVAAIDVTITADVLARPTALQAQAFRLPDFRP